MIYGGGIILPLVLGLMMKAFGSKNPISMVVTGYGYSFAVFVPVTFICTTPFTVVQVCALVYACVSSSGFLMTVYWQQVRDLDQWKKIIVMVIVIGFQASLVLVYKFYFFTYVI